MAFDLHKWVKELKVEDNLFIFEGELQESDITNILYELEDKLLNNDLDKKILKKVYNIAIESLQNLFHHSEYIEYDDSEKYNCKFSSLIIKQVDNNDYKIITGNFILDEKRNFLKERIDKINNLDKLQLKILYKEVLNNQSYSNKGGGGLGLIDIARKSGNKLKYNFYSYKNSLSFFKFCTEVK